MPFLPTSSRAIADSMSSSSSIDRLQSLAGKLALHRQRHQEFLSHQAQTHGLHRPFVAEELHPYWPPLPDAPRPSAGLSQTVKRIA